jgi:hypothetical protein
VLVYFSWWHISFIIVTDKADQWNSSTCKWACWSGSRYQCCYALPLARRLLLLLHLRDCLVLVVVLPFRSLSLP